MALSLILVVTALAYLPSLENGFTNWDDKVYVTENQDIRELSASSIGHFFTSFLSGNYHPLTTLSYALEYHLRGLDPAIYHVVNLTLHLANTLLAFWLVHLLSGSLAASLVASLLFGIHPLHVESVAWISERKDVLSTFFFFGALVAYLRYQPGKKGRVFCWLSFSLLACSLLSKSMAVTFPLVMVLCDQLLGRKPDRKSWTEKLPFVALAAVFAVLALLSQGATEVVRGHERFPVRDNIFIPGYGLLFYLGKLVFPVGLSALYPLPLETNGRLPIPFLISPLAAAVAIAGFWYAARRSREILFGGLFFLVTIAPVLQLIPLGRAFAADRYLYIPSLGLFYLVGVGFAKLVSRRDAASRSSRPLLWGAFGMLVLTFSALTWQRTTVWKDSITLWNDILGKYPRTSSLAWARRGDAHFELDEYDLAVRDYTAALDLNAKNALVYLSRGRAWLRIGERSRDPSVTEKALADLERARELNPILTAYKLRGYALAFKGDLPGALAELNQAVRLLPWDAEAHLYRGNVLKAMGRLEEAVSDYTAAIALSPGDAEAYYHRANALLLLGDHGGAIRDFDEALKRKPDHAEAFNNRGAAHLAGDEVEEALADFSKAIEINRSYSGAYANRARLRAQLGMQDLAAEDQAMAAHFAAPAAGDERGGAEAGEGSSGR